MAIRPRAAAHGRPTWWRSVSSAVPSIAGRIDCTNEKAPQLRGFFVSPLSRSRRSVMDGRQRRGIQVRDGARVLECADAFDTLLAADAGCLHAPERCAKIQA